MRSIKLFVPGRLCLFGEHSDWTATYKNENKNIIDGKAIVTCIDNGIYAKASKSNKLVIKEKKQELVLPIDINIIKQHIKLDDYYSYILSTCSIIIKNYNVGGINIDIYKSTLPEKKGLSSSAAICILICKAFDKLYNLHLTKEDYMSIAYQSERNIKSMCGKMDQIVAYESKAALMEFVNNDTLINRIEVGKDLYMVYVDLNGKKDTKKILSSLNSIYPYPENKKEQKVIDYFGRINNNIVNEAVKLLKEGKIEKLGKLMTKAQKLFDNYVSYICEEQLTAPLLHKLLCDKYIEKITYGGKGVGSGGDGCAQFIVKDEVIQKKLIGYLKNKYNMKAYPLKISKHKKINKAVIPLAGLGSRMRPFTNVIPKGFIPVVKENKLVPVFDILIDELIQSGIEKVYLIISKQQLEFYKKYLDNKNKYKNKITIVIQKKPKGLADAILKIRKFISKESFLLVLGDQFYATKSKINCTTQLLNEYEKKQKILVSVTPIKTDKANSYGIYIFDKKTKKILNIIEKPDKKTIKKLFSNKDNCYAAFGEYIIDSNFLDYLYSIKNENVNEIDFTEELGKFLKKHEGYVFVPKGNMYDVGNISAYLEMINNYYK